MQEDRSVKFLWLKQEDVIAADGLNMPETMRVVEQAFALDYQGDVIEPESPAIRFNPEFTWRVVAHPAYVGGEVNIAGLKWIPADPENPQKRGFPRATPLTILSRKETGWPVAVMDSTIPHAMRTAAVTGIGAKYLARQDSRVVGLYGCGPINRMQIEAVKVAVPGIQEVRVYARRREPLQQFCRERSHALGLPFEAVGNPQAAAVGADIIVCATTGVTPTTSYLEADWLKPGAFVAEVSTNDLKYNAILKADRISLDMEERLHQRRGGVGLLYHHGLLPRSRFSTLPEIVSGVAPGRQDDRQIIYQKAMGRSIEDIVAAWRIWKVAKERGIGQELTLWREPAWV